jgi:hypothetical protein
MSRTLALGKLSCSDSQLSPSSKETQTPVSVPAKRRPGVFGSSRTARVYAPTGIPRSMRVQLLP